MPGVLLGCLVRSGLAPGDVGSLGNHIVDLGLGLLDHVLVAVLDAHTARNALHAGVLYRSAGEQLVPAVPSRKPPPTSRVLNVDFFMLLLPFAAQARHGALAPEFISLLEHAFETSLV